MVVKKFLWLPLLMGWYTLNDPTEPLKWTKCIIIFCELNIMTLALSSNG